MEFYLFILIILFTTAIADLIVGVSNDAVNFLNSAIGSKVATRRTIMIIASLGVLVGTTFSSGIMEVARKGIFNPEYFTMHEVMIIFLAVMLTDIILLDLYNTFGLPTSTTVSIVFEILGGAVALAILKFTQEGNSLLTYINTEKVLTIISSIGLSIIFAFIFGFLIQFLSRLVFTFNYENKFKRYGAIYCAISVTAITIFILIKGAKGSSFLTKDVANMIQQNITLIIIISVIAWTIIWQFFISFTKIKTLNIVVLIGTFALALAFAANDLVNFIGAPLGALSAYMIGAAQGVNPLTFTMEALTQPVQANTFILLFAGAIMVITLWKSRKAQSVTKTEVNLGRQSEGVERFSSSVLARSIVRMGIGLTEITKKITPEYIQKKVIERTNPESFQTSNNNGEKPAFDLIRASVNLMVASALVSIGTTLKLPLSTTFVTFTVAMATSLADKAWGRDSAVYRVNGMLTVIGGWFFTAFMAFTTCFAFTLFIYFVGLPAILILLVFGFFFYFRTTRIHKEREELEEKSDEERKLEIEDLGSFEVIKNDISKFLNSLSEYLDKFYNAVQKNDLKKLGKLRKIVENIALSSDKIIGEIFIILKESQEEEKGLVPRYAQNVASLNVISTNLKKLTYNTYEHLNNNHHAFISEQISELHEVFNLLDRIITLAEKYIKNNTFKNLDEIKNELNKLRSLLKKFNKNQMKRIKTGKTGNRLSMLFIGILSNTERIAEQIINILGLLKESSEDTD